MEETRYGGLYDSPLNNVYGVIVEVLHIEPTVVVQLCWEDGAAGRTGKSCVLTSHSEAVSAQGLK